MRLWADGMQHKVHRSCFCGPFLESHPLCARSLALQWGLLTCQGKTPEATMASSLYGDVKRRDPTSVFVRPKEGLFGLREWVEQGLLDPAPDPPLKPKRAGPPRTLHAALRVRAGFSVFVGLN